MNFTIYHYLISYKAFRFRDSSKNKSSKAFAHFLSSEINSLSQRRPHRQESRTAWTELDFSTTVELYIIAKSLGHVSFPRSPFLFTLSPYHWLPPHSLIAPRTYSKGWKSPLNSIMSYQLCRHFSSLCVLLWEFISAIWAISIRGDCTSTRVRTLTRPYEGPSRWFSVWIVNFRIIGTYILIPPGVPLDCSPIIPPCIPPSIRGR